MRPALFVDMDCDFYGATSTALEWARRLVLELGACATTPRTQPVSRPADVLRRARLTPHVRVAVGAVAGVGPRRRRNAHRLRRLVDVDVRCTRNRRDVEVALKRNRSQVE